MRIGVHTPKEKSVSASSKRRIGAVLTVIMLLLVAMYALVPQNKATGLNLSLSTQVSFWDDFEDYNGEIGNSPWSVTVFLPPPMGPNEFDLEMLSSPPTEWGESGVWSAHMYSVMYMDGLAYAESPEYNLDDLTDYFISFDFMIPNLANGVFTVVRNKDVWLMLEKDNVLAARLDDHGLNIPLPNAGLTPQKWYHIECWVQEGHHVYDVLLDGVWIDRVPQAFRYPIIQGGPPPSTTDTLTIGDEDQENAAAPTSFGEAYWDNILVGTMYDWPWSDDLQDGDMSDWTTATSDMQFFDLIFLSGDSHEWVTHMYFNSPGPPVTSHALSSFYNLYYFEQYIITFYIKLPMAAGGEFTALRDGRVWLTIHPSSELYVYVSDTQSFPVMSLNVGSWHRIECRVQTSNGMYELYVDMDFKGSFPFWVGDDSASPIAGHASKNLYMGALEETGNGEAFWDDFQIDTFNPDTDGDGIPDWWEITHDLDPMDPDDGDKDWDADLLTNLEEYQTGTDPWNPDCDSDKLIDGYEVKVSGTDPLAQDTESDSVTDFDEFCCLSSPFVPDTDFDTLSDYDEINIHFTNPASPDSDDDGLRDDFEISIGTNPWLRDSDNDGLSDGDEDVNGNGLHDAGSEPHPLDPDTDDDQILDGDEPQWDVDTDNDGLINALDTDSDDDGLLDCTEDANHNGFLDVDESSPVSEDTDADGVDDASEVDPYVDTDADGLVNIRDTDSDDDMLTDGDEQSLGSSMVDPDTDSDGLEDGLEYAFWEFLEPGLATQDSDSDMLENLVDYDSDNDGLSDGFEKWAWGTEDTDGDMLFNIIDPDSDGDGVSDGEETLFGASPIMVDTDGDGLNDFDETTYFLTRPDIVDTDGDDFTDHEEVLYYGEDLARTDSDGDGLWNILDVDSDDGGVPDGYEVWVSFTDPLDPTDDPDDAWIGGDFDGDGLLNEDEGSDTDEDGICYPTSPYNPDTDGDGIEDGDERDFWANLGNPATLNSDDDLLPNIIDPDSDNDLFWDGDEKAYFEQRDLEKPGNNYGPLDNFDYPDDLLENIIDPDSDNDGLDDGVEVESYEVGEIDEVLEFPTLGGGVTAILEIPIRRNGLLVPIDEETVYLSPYSYGPGSAFSDDFVPAEQLRSIDAGDLDLDGDMDLVVGSSQSPYEVVVYYNDGYGDFSLDNTKSYEVGNYPVDVALGDLNFDGFLDIITANYWEASISTLFNDGDGTFANRKDYSTLYGGPRSIALADFDMQLGLDVAVADSESNFITVFYNDGSGWFGQTEYYSPWLGSNRVPYALATGQFNVEEDQYPDIVVVANDEGAGVGYVMVLENDGSGGFPDYVTIPPTGSLAFFTSVVVTDIDHLVDDYDDFWVGNDEGFVIKYHLGDGYLGFEDGYHMGVGGGYDLFAGDVNSDDCVDLISIYRDDGPFPYTRLEIHFGDGSGDYIAHHSRQWPGLGDWRIFSGPIDADEHSDIAITDPEGLADPYLQNSPGILLRMNMEYPRNPRFDFIEDDPTDPVWFWNGRLSYSVNVPSERVMDDLLAALAELSDVGNDGSWDWKVKVPIVFHSDTQSMMEVKTTTDIGGFAYATDPLDTDSDGDGIDDGDEVNTYETNPTSTDSDGDGLDDKTEKDLWENNGIDIFSNPDGDEYTNLLLDYDSDNDGMSDGFEYDFWNEYNPGRGLWDDIEDPDTLPPMLDRDSDDDGWADNAERVYFIAQENRFGESNDYHPFDDWDGDSWVNILDSDSDSDLYLDGDDLAMWTYGVQYHANGVVRYLEPDVVPAPVSYDWDDDGIRDTDEIVNYGLNPTNRDTDDDGISDWDEQINVLIVSDPHEADSDGDGLVDGTEIALGTDYLDWDTDDDGAGDASDIQPTRRWDDITWGSRPPDFAPGDLEAETQFWTYSPDPPFPEDYEYCKKYHPSSTICWIIDPDHPQELLKIDDTGSNTEYLWRVHWTNRDNYHFLWRKAFKVMWETDPGHYNRFEAQMYIPEGWDYGAVMRTYLYYNVAVYDGATEIFRDNFPARSTTEHVYGMDVELDYDACTESSYEVSFEPFWITLEPFLGGSPEVPHVMEGFNDEMTIITGITSYSGEDGRITHVSGDMDPYTLDIDVSGCPDDDLCYIAELGVWAYVARDPVDESDIDDIEDIADDGLLEGSTNEVDIVVVETESPDSLKDIEKIEWSMEEWLNEYSQLPWQNEGKILKGIGKVYDWHGEDRHWKKLDNNGDLVVAGDFTVAYPQIDLLANPFATHVDNYFIGQNPDLAPPETGVDFGKDFASGNTVYRRDLGYGPYEFSVVSRDETWYFHYNEETRWTTAVNIDNPYVEGYSALYYDAQTGEMWGVHAETGVPELIQLSGPPPFPTPEELTISDFTVFTEVQLDGYIPPDYSDVDINYGLEVEIYVEGELWQADSVYDTHDVQSRDYTSRSNSHLKVTLSGKTPALSWATAQEFSIRAGEVVSFGGYLIGTGLMVVQVEQDIQMFMDAGEIGVEAQAYAALKAGVDTVSGSFQAVSGMMTTQIGNWNLARWLGISIPSDKMAVGKLAARYAGYGFAIAGAFYLGSAIGAAIVGDYDAALSLGMISAAFFADAALMFIPGGPILQAFCFIVTAILWLFSILDSVMGCFGLLRHSASWTYDALT